MLKGGLLPSPIITPLSSSPLAAKNKIHTQTFVEIRSGFIDIIVECVNKQFFFLAIRCFKCTNLFYC